MCDLQPSQNYTEQQLGLAMGARGPPSPIAPVQQSSSRHQTRQQLQHSQADMPPFASGPHGTVRNSQQVHAVQRPAVSTSAGHAQIPAAVAFFVVNSDRRTADVACVFTS
jgi:hypothetical protein